MTIVFGSPEARTIVERDRVLVKEHEQRERAAAAFDGKPLKRWLVAGRAPVECTVAAPDWRTAIKMAKDFCDWDYAGGDAEGLTAEPREDAPSEYMLAEAQKWATRWS